MPMANSPYREHRCKSSLSDMVDSPPRLSANKRAKGKPIAMAQALGLASGAAVLAAVGTAVGTIMFLTNFYDNQIESHISTTTNRVVSSRTLRYTTGMESLEPNSFEDRLASSKQIGNVRMKDQPSHMDFGQGLLDESVPTYTATDIPLSSDQSGSGLLNMIPKHFDFSRSTFNDGKEDNSQPKVAWLMSYPNSGTSYTIHLIRESSNTTTATNYALEGDIKDEPSVLAIEGQENGPFLELIKNRHTSMPKYILTKTHCGGYCTKCGPIYYIETPRSFQTMCLNGKRAVNDPNGDGLIINQVHYRPELVHKAVHIIRNPLDNVVARFHLEFKRAGIEHDDEFMTNFPRNNLGFQKWCASTDQNRRIFSSRLVDEDLARVLSKIPCHAEFFRYVQWHNLAFSVTQDMGIPSHVLHYKDYRDDHDGAVDGLLQFLELEKVGVGPEFSIGKEYSMDHYSASQRNAIAAFLKEMSSAQTWQHLKQYTVGY